MAFAKSRWVQVGGCALLALVVVRGGNLWREDTTAGSTPAASNAATGSSLASPSGAAQIGVKLPAAAPASFGLSTVEVIVGANDTMERIFRRLELSLSELAALRAMPGLRAKLDRLYPGELLKIDLRGPTLFALERRLSASETLHVRRDGAAFATTVVTNPLETSVHTGTGVVNSSLFEAAADAGIADVTALQIAEIFAWDIDFVLDIQRGDRFSVTFERIEQDGTYVRDGNILAVEFVNQGRSYRAVRYTPPDGKPGYFTPEGTSLRKAFIRAPVEFTRISSRFNLARRHPVLNRLRAHQGVDYAAPIGTPVRAAGDGRVRFLGRKGGYGNVIEIEHMNRVTTLYGHLSRFQRGLVRGERVEQGQVVGFVGMTGLATGPHLHYEYRVNGVHKDPQRVPLPKTEPIPAQLLAEFRAVTGPALDLLSAGPGGGTSPASLTVASAP